MNQNVWGPHLWFFLHTLTFNYPFNPSEEHKKRIKDFFYNLQYMLPCRYCRDNYKRNLKETPIRLNSRKDMVHWLIDLHNEVNGQTGKRTMPYHQAIQLYEQAYQKKLPLTKDEEQRYTPTQSGYDPRFPLFIILTVGLLYAGYRYVR